MKILIGIMFIMLSIWSCNNDIDTPITPTKIDSLTQFPLKIGYVWNYKNSANQNISLTIKRLDTIKFINSWFLFGKGAIETYIYNTYYMEMKILKGSFPEYQDFEIIEKDSSFILCSNFHPLLNNIPGKTYFEYFRIPKYFTNQSYQVHKYADVPKNQNYVDSISITFLEKRLFGSINSDVYKIDYYSFIYVNDKLLKTQGMNFEFANKIGFVKFMNAPLTNYNIGL